MYTTKDTVKYLPDKMHCKTEKSQENKTEERKKNININNTYINVLDVRSLLKTINECQENSPRPPQTANNADAVACMGGEKGLANTETQTRIETKTFHSCIKQDVASLPSCCHAP